MRINSSKNITGKYTPERSCMGCGVKGDKSTFIRLVYDENSDKIVVDHKQNMSGRGVYLCTKKGCYSKLIKRKILIRFLQQDDIAADSKTYLDTLG